MQPHFSATARDSSCVRFSSSTVRKTLSQFQFVPARVQLQAARLAARPRKLLPQADSHSHRPDEVAARRCAAASFGDRKTPTSQRKFVSQGSAEVGSQLTENRRPNQTPALSPRLWVQELHQWMVAAVETTHELRESAFSIMSSSVARENGFCRNNIPGSSTPWWTIAFGV